MLSDPESTKSQRRYWLKIWRVLSIFGAIASLVLLGAFSALAASENAI
jgi:hypothetical protein